MEPAPPLIAVSDGSPPAHDTSSLREFLDRADAERIRLEQALDTTRRRRRMVESLLRSELHRTGRLAMELDDLTRHLDEERRATWHDVQAVLAEAEVEAAAIVAAARATADDILSAPPVALRAVASIPVESERLVG